MSVQLTRLLSAGNLSVHILLKAGTNQVTVLGTSKSSSETINVIKILIFYYPLKVQF